MDSEGFIHLMKQPKREDVFKLGMVQNSKIKLDGESTPSSKSYKKLNNITLTEGSRVLLAKVKGTYVILGELT